MIIKTVSNTINVGKLILSLIVVSIIGLSACKSNNIDGFYDGHIQAVIRNDSVTLYEPERYSKILIGKCKISHLEGKFYTLKSCDFPKILFNNVSIEYVKPQNPDSLFLTIKIPNISHFIYNVNLFDLSGANYYEFECYNKSDSIKIAIPPELYRFNNTYHISLTPVVYWSYMASTQYNGLLTLTDYCHSIHIDNHDIIVKYPDLTIENTYMWYFDDVIVRIDDKSMMIYGYNLKKK